MTARRIPGRGLVDPARPLAFSFDGRAMTGLAGDTLASALLANGVRITGRSFKYHRPRGVWGAWTEDPGVILDVTLGERRATNVPGAATMLEDGMALRAVNAWPSAARDLKGGLDLFHGVLGAGFYYKTFMWPGWRTFEPAIRRMAGLGRLPAAPDAPALADQRHDACELLVVGGGAAGLAAARQAAEAGRDVVLVEDHPELGGALHRLGAVEGQAAPAWIAAARDAILAAGGRILTSTTAFAIHDHRLVMLARSRGLFGRPELVRMRAGRVLLAAGAVDQPRLFPDNDRPGVMSLAAADEHLGRYGVRAGTRLAILAAAEAAEGPAARLAAAGAEVIRLDPAAGEPRALGRRGLVAVRQAGLRIEADALLVSAGAAPAIQLWRMAGGRADWDARLGAFVPGEGPDFLSAAGAANGAFDLDAALAEARAAALEAPRAARPAAPAPVAPAPAAQDGGRRWIDLQNDVTLDDVALAARENFVSIEHLKRYTTLGMGTDQGRTANLAGLVAMAGLRGLPAPAVGTTAFRPPVAPQPLPLWRGERRGGLVHPLRRLALEPEHRAAGARFGEYGGWLRPAWHGEGDPETCARREAKMARETAGLIDASPLGKIEVMGPGAAAFLDFVCYGTLSTLKPGAIRYGFMLAESGAILDDGVVARLEDERFLVSCSSGHVDAVARHLEIWRQDGNDPDRIFVHDATQAWATVAVSGPQARQIVSALGTGLDLAPAAFPHMTLRETEWRGGAMRLARVSFTGDLSFEVSVRASRAAELWQALTAAAAPLGAGPIGVEALTILRAEKGFVIVGKDTDGETMPHDLGFGLPRRRKSAAFVGDRGLWTEVATHPDRRQLVGLETPAGAPPLPVGAHVVAAGPDGRDRSEGFVTSSHFSPALDRPVALALLERGAARHGEALRLRHLGAELAATARPPCAFDPEGERLDA